MFQWGHVERDEYVRRRKDVEAQLRALPAHRDEMDLREAARWLVGLPEV
jgi:hypothetical protein